MLIVCLLACLGAQAAAEAPANLCPNPGAEEVDSDGLPRRWQGPTDKATADRGEAHSGRYSLKLSLETAGVRGWTSAPIPVPSTGSRFALSVWAKLDGVVGGNGATIWLTHFDAAGERIGASGRLTLGGEGETVCTRPWRQYVSTCMVTPEVKSVSVHVRLYKAKGTVWLDDVSLISYAGEISRPRPLRQGLRLAGNQLAIVAADGADDLAGEIRAALAAKGVDAPIIDHRKVDLQSETRDLIVLGNLMSSRAAKHLYINYYTYEDLYFPGPGGHVLRPLIDPLGTGANMLVVGASDGKSLATAVHGLIEHIRSADAVLAIPLVVEAGVGYHGIKNFPWASPGPYREMRPAAAYLKSGDMAYARKYRDYILDDWFSHSDESLADRGNELHLVYHSMTMSWDLAEACGAFTDVERLRLTRQLLKILRSNQGVGFKSMYSTLHITRGNHAIRNARSFYFGYRYFAKYHAEALGPELDTWRKKLEDFWAVCLTSFRSGEDSLTDHAFSGSLNNILDMALMEPQWSKKFFASGLAQQMGDRCIAACNNMGEVVLSGDCAPSAYPSALFAKLAYRLRDGRYRFMIDKRGATRTDSDEAMRGFNVGIEPRVPDDHVGLRVIPADPLFFNTGLLRKTGVTVDRAFDKITLRSGFDPDDEYLLLEGVAGTGHAYEDANGIIEFSANGRRWLTQFDRFAGPTMSFHNVVTVARDGLGTTEVPQAAELLRQASGDGYAYTATRLPHYNGTAWTRHMLWLPNAYTVVLDEIAADEPGNYAFVLGWRSLGRPSLKPGRFEAAQDEPVSDGLFFDGEALAKAATESSAKGVSHKPQGNLLKYGAEGKGDYVQATIHAPGAGLYDVSLVTRNTKLGWIIQVSIDGGPVGQPVDAYTNKGAGDVETDLGKMQLTQGDHQVRFTVAGRNAKSSARYMAIAGLRLRGAGAPAEPRGPAANRFQLVFPSDVPALLERDTEQLGALLPPSRYRDQAINVLEQTAQGRLATGERVCFQNVFYATRGEPSRRVEVKRLGDHALLVKSADGVALVGASVDGATVAAGAVSASGKAFYVSATRVLLIDAKAQVGGKPLAHNDTASAAAVGEALSAAWKAGRSVAPRTTEQAPLPALTSRWRGELPAEPHSVIAWGGPKQPRLPVGMSNGQVQVWGHDGTATGDVKTNGPVHALTGCDLNGDGVDGLLVGSDDEHVYAFDAGLKEQWKRRVPFKERRLLFWSLGSSKVRRLVAADLDGDRKPEILIGAGNRRLHCWDTAGNERWSFRTLWGVCTTIVTADLFGDGRQLVIAGNGKINFVERCWVLDAKGELVDTFYGEKAGANIIVVADLDGDGKNTLFSGNRCGRLRAWTVTPEPTVPQQRRRKVRWVRAFPKPIGSLCVLPGEKADLIAVGCDSAYLCAFDEAGTKAWGLSLTGGVRWTAIVRRPDGKRVLAAGCKDSSIYLISPAGKRLARFQCEGRLRDMIAVDLDADGTDEIVAVAANPHRIYVVNVK